MPDDLQRSNLFTRLTPLMEKPEYQEREEIQEVMETWRESGKKIQDRIAEETASTSLEQINEEQDASIRAMLLSVDALEQRSIAKKDPAKAKQTRLIRKRLAPLGTNALTHSSHAEEIARVSEFVATTKRPDIQTFLQENGLSADAALVEANHKAFEAAWKNPPSEQKKEETSKIKEARKQFDEGLSLLLSYLRSQAKRKEEATKKWAAPLLEEIEKAELAASLRREERSKPPTQANPPGVTPPQENPPAPALPAPPASENKPH